MFPRTGVPPCTKITHIVKINLNTEGRNPVRNGNCVDPGGGPGMTPPTWSAGVIQADLLWGQGSDVCVRFHWEMWGHHVSYFLGQLGGELGIN